MLQIKRQVQRCREQIPEDLGPSRCALRASDCVVRSHFSNGIEQCLRRRIEKFRLFKPIESHLSKVVQYHNPPSLTWLTCPPKPNVLFTRKTTCNPDNQPKSNPFECCPQLRATAEAEPIPVCPTGRQASTTLCPPTCSRLSSFSSFSRSSCPSNISCAATNPTARADTHPIVYSSSQSTRHSGHRFDVTMIRVGGIVGYEGY